MIEHLKAAWAEMTAPGSPFAITEAEVLGRRMRVFEAAPPNLRVLWEGAVAGFADADYIVYEDERYTYAEIGAQVRALAHHLRDEHGVGSGDRVAVAMRNYPEWIVSYWAGVSLGAAVVGMNAWWTTSEMEYGLSDSKPKVLIADEERIERVAPVLEGLRKEAPLHVIAVRTGIELPEGTSRWEDVVRPEAAPATLPDATIDPDDDGTIFYTSGTTGSPKGAQLTHRGSVHNLLHVAFMTAAMNLAMAKAAEAAGEEPAPAPPADAQAVLMAPTPLFHVTACNCGLHPMTASGGRLVLTRKWDAGRALELIEREGVSAFSGVPSMNRELLMHPDWATRDTSSLVRMSGGGAAVQRDLVSKIDASLPQGSPGTGYGMTETNGIVTANGALFYTAKPESAGPLVPTVDAKLIDDLGNELPPGSVGELCVRGPVVIKGYLNRPEATAEAIQDGWFRTGDIARIDEDGFVFIVDRAKDMVIRGGENVYCAEVEAAIYEHPSVTEAAVFGIPDDRLGEAVAAAIVVKEGADLTEEDLAAHLAPRISAHKIPSRVWFRTELLPRNASGKYLKRALRDDLLKLD
jgi:long-chain acyl-CoA synthetase